MAAASLPAGILLTALGGVSPAIALRLMLAIIPVGMLGVWFGLGWGLAFSLRRPGGAVSTHSLVDQPAVSPGHHPVGGRGPIHLAMGLAKHGALRA